MHFYKMKMLLMIFAGWICTTSVVTSQCDSVTATLLEEVLSLKDQVNILSNQVSDLQEAVDSCGSCSSATDSAINDTYTVNQII